MSLSANINEKAALIWAIADKLTGVYKPHEYGEVILPLTVIRRFDCILGDTKDAVLEKYESVKKLPMRDVLLRSASKHPFYNTSKYTFEKLLDDPDNIEANFRDYLNGFSENVQDIIQKFKFDGHIATMSNIRGGEFFAELRAAFRTVHGFRAHHACENAVAGTVRKQLRAVTGFLSGDHAAAENGGDLVAVAF